MNKSESNIKRSRNPYDEANWLSKFCYWWLKDLFIVGFSKSITEEEICSCSKQHKSKECTENFNQIWQEELRNSQPSLLKTIMKFCGLKIILIGIPISILELICKLSAPIMLGYLIAYFTDNPYQITKNGAFLLATGIIATQLMQVILYYPFKFYIYIEAIKVKIACCSLIYDKILAFTKYTLSDGISGQAINLMSNDITRFELALSFLNDLWQSPVGSTIAGFLVYQQIEMAAFGGLALFAIFMPFQLWLGRKTANVRLSTAKRTDKRVRFMMSILNGIQVIKMYGWEHAFSKVIHEIRKHEIAAIARGYNIRSTLLSFEVLSKVAIFLSLISYVLMGNALTAQKAFIVIALLDYIHRSMIFYWPDAIMYPSEAYVSVKRIEEFLLHNIDRRDAIEGVHEHKELSNKKGIILRNASAYWNQDVYNNIGIFRINFDTRNHHLIAFTGQVGSGKTSLLEVILKELPLTNGDLEVNGVTSYASQGSWIFEGSIRSNILFTEDYDVERYKRVVHVCSLERDLKLLPYGDQTIVGDRGVSLSGGQKARVSLARAIYKKADIYLLDDPLSAVDPHVCKHIFEKCIKEFLKDKICILVTHQIQFLSAADLIIVMNQGKIQAQGTYEDVKANDEDFRKALESFKESPTIEERIATMKIIKPSPTQTNKQQKSMKESQQLSNVKSTVYVDYLNAINNVAVVIFVSVLFMGTQIMDSCVSIFVSIWVRWEHDVNGYSNVTKSTVHPAKWTTETHIYVYTAMIGIYIALAVSKAFAFYRTCLRISQNLHDRMFAGVTRSFMYFFNQNPTGRILNRFSKDIGTIDSTLPIVVVDCLKFFLELAGILAIVVATNYWLIFPSLIVCIIFFILRNIFLATARNIKRVEAITRSPIFSHSTATLEGLSTIRAFDASKHLKDEFNELLDVNTSSFFLFVGTSRSFAFWLDLICVVFVAVVVYSFLMIGDNVSGASVGLVITQTMNLIRMVNWGLRETAELENQMTSVERVAEYSKLPNERSLETDVEKLKNLPSHWAENGRIQFKNVSLKYSKESNYVLQNLSFEICEREKIGLIGRTGSGKSSITQALFQLAITAGKIEIDGIDIGELGLHTFRQKISIIPQNPILFMGTLRYNLDPFNEKTDDEIWNALEQVELKESIKILTGGLESKVSDDGSNFSMGQRQLICLARAILKNNKILILDEATSNCDTETDKLIQTTIRNKFNDCTVLTIAHRLASVLDNNRLMVLDAGNICEFDTPSELYKKKNGIFRKLFDESGLDINLFDKKTI